MFYQVFKEINLRKRNDEMKGVGVKAIEAKNQKLGPPQVGRAF